MNSFCCLGEEAYEFTDELATHATGGEMGDHWLKGIFKERLLQVVLVAAQGAISRRVQWHKLAYADDKRRREEQG